MTDNRSEDGGRADVDPERDPSANPFDNRDEWYGQDYAREHEEAMGKQQPSGHPLIGDPVRTTMPTSDPEGRDIPSEAGRRAWIDCKTGEVHGSGSGAGGGRSGEDYDEETSGGS